MKLIWCLQSRLHQQMIDLRTEAFAQLLQAPQEEAQCIINERYPVPRLVVCNQHGSQERFLLARLNPLATYNSTHNVASGSDIIFIDGQYASVLRASSEANCAVMDIRKSC